MDWVIGFLIDCLGVIKSKKEGPSPLFRGL